MKFRFSVISSVNPTARFGVSITEPSLNEKIFLLEPLKIKSAYQPSIWSGVFDIDIKNVNVMKYNFIRWTDSELPLSEKVTTIKNELEIPECCVIDFQATYPSTNCKIEYELKNRFIVFTDVVKSKFKGKVHVFDESMNIIKDTYTLPTVVFSADSNSDIFLKSLIPSVEENSLSLDYDRILKRVLVGEHPRTPDDVLYLQKYEDVTDILSFQSSKDIRVNSIIDKNNKPITDLYTLIKFYESMNIRFVWHPIKEFDALARATNLAQSVLLLTAMLNRPDCKSVYVHCNAGISRSVSCVAGFLHCILGASHRQTNLIINTRRPIALFDGSSLEYGSKDFFFKFEGIQHDCKNAKK